jgi:hypothetical protein
MDKVRRSHDDTSSYNPINSAKKLSQKSGSGKGLRFEPELPEKGAKRFSISIRFILSK